jgi:peptide/nickel transport system substrate-binding protein
MARSIAWKQFGVAFILVAMLLVSACAAPAPAPSASESGGEAPAEATAGEPVYGGELIFVVSTEPDGVDAHLAAYANAFLVNRNVCDTLVAKTSDGEFVPHLATDWEIAEDGLSYTFNLRDDVTFHDGTPFNAEAVKFNLERVASPELASRLAVSYLGPFESAEVLDEYSVKVNFSRPHAAFMNVFASWIGMVSPTAAAAADPADFNWMPICSGPFKFEEYVAQSHVSFVANPDYNWAPPIFEHEGRPYLDRVVIRFIPDESTRVAALETGEVDAIKDVPASALNMLADMGTWTIVEEELAGPGIHYVPNASRAPLDDKLVRQALLYATSQEEIRDLVFQGNGPTIHSVFSPATPCFDQEAYDMYRYNPERAAELLDEAGWLLNEATGIREKDGEPLTITITAVDLGNASEMNEVMISQWAQVGIQAETELLASAGIQVARAQGADFDVIWRSFGANDANILSTLYHSRNAGPDKGWNFTHQAFPELDALLDEGDVVSDPVARCEIYTQAQRMIMEEALSIPVQPRLSYVAYGDTVHNLPASWAGVIDIPFYDVYVTK